MLLWLLYYSSVLTSNFKAGLHRTSTSLSSWIFKFLISVLTRDSWESSFVILEVSSPTKTGHGRRQGRPWRILGRERGPPRLRTARTSSSRGALFQRLIQLKFLNFKVEDFELWTIMIWFWIFNDNPFLEKWLFLNVFANRLEHPNKWKSWWGYPTVVHG